jgi:hypothetical protein
MSAKGTVVKQEPYSSQAHQQHFLKYGIKEQNTGREGIVIDHSTLIISITHITLMISYYIIYTLYLT